jgi:hypothetical protein
MKKRLITLTFIALTLTPLSEFRLPNSAFPPLPPVLAETKPGFEPPPAPPAPRQQAESDPPSFSDLISFLDSGVAAVQDFFDQTVGQVTGVIGQVFGLFDQVFSPLQSLYQDAQALARLITKVVNFPSTVSGWWQGLIGSITGEFDACFNAVEGAVTPPFLFEAGWCFGGDSSGALSDDLELLGHTSPPPAPPAGEHGDGDGDGDWQGHTLPPPAPPAGRKSVGDIVQAAQGPAGLPVPSLLRYESERAVEAGGGDGDRFEVNPTILKHYLGNRAERGVARLQAESVIGTAGQAKMLEELTGIQQAVAGNFGTAGAAQSLSVTQDVMKQMVQMQASETLLLGSLAAGNQQLRVDNALTHLNLSNISRSLDEQNRSRRIDRTLHAYKVLRSVSQSTLF